MGLDAAALYIHVLAKEDREACRRRSAALREGGNRWRRQTERGTEVELMVDPTQVNFGNSDEARAWPANEREEREAERPSGHHCGE